MIVHLSEVGYVYQPSDEKATNGYKNLSGLKVVGTIEHPTFTLCGLSVQVSTSRKAPERAHDAIETVADLNHPSTCAACLKRMPQRKASGIQPVYLRRDPAEQDVSHAAE